MRDACLHNTRPLPTTRALAVQLWLSINAAFHITEQHRIRVDRPGGAELYRYSRYFMHWGVTIQEIAHVCEELNKRALANLAAHAPQADELRCLPRPLTIQGLVSAGLQPQAVVLR